MATDDFDWEAEFADDPDWQALDPAERERLISVMEKMLAMGMAAVYGDEAPDEPDADVPCARVLDQCRARCCTFIFALTREEVAAGHVAWNREKPYFIARDAGDGYCPHLDRQTFECTIWAQRPRRCRRYDCRQDRDVWPEGFPALPA